MITQITELFGLSVYTDRAAYVGDVEDVVDAILERAVTQEAELELVRSNEARRLLPPGEPIGALLRF